MKKVLIYKNNSKEAAYLLAKDPNLKQLLAKNKEIKIILAKDYYQALVQTIISQQLSTRVAEVIYQRLETLMNEKINAKEMIALDEQVLRDIGVSRPKIKYLKSLAEHVVTNKIKFENFDTMEDQEIIETLTSVKGIGVWTAQMFLMFSMGREDVFSTLDLGLRRALKNLLNKPDMTLEEIEIYSQKWKPYRTFVSHYLWNS